MWKCLLYTLSNNIKAGLLKYLAQFLYDAAEIVVSVGLNTRPEQIIQASSVSEVSSTACNIAMKIAN